MPHRPTSDASKGDLYCLEIATDAPDLVSSHLIDAGYLQGTEIESGPNSELDRVISYMRLPHPPSEDQVRHELEELLAALEPLDWELRSFEAQHDESWQESWRDSFEPTSLSDRITVQPPWSDLPDSKQGVVLTINPGMAFGTGHHATTRLATRLLDTRLGTFEGTPSCLDVGCGSGVLSMAAARLGAAPVEGLDIDREILQVARENLERNELTDAVSLSLRPVGELDETYDLVVANIRSRILRDLRDDLLERVHPDGGHLLISGVMSDQRDEFLDDFAPPSTHWELVDERELDHWLGFNFYCTSTR